MEDIKKLTDLGEELQTGFKALKDAHEQAKKDTDGLIGNKIKQISEELGTKLEEVQTRTAKLEAVAERVAANDNTKSDEEEKSKRAAFIELLRKGDIRNMDAGRVKGLATDSLDNGGYMVPVQSMGLINGQLFETSPVRSIANVITTSAKSAEWVLDDSEAGFAWAGEGDTVSATNTPVLGRIEIAAHKAIAYPAITEELAADAAFDVESWLANKIADKIARGQNTAFVTGNGVNAPRGFLTYAAGTSTYARNKLEQVNMGSSSAPTEAGLIALQGALKEDYQTNAVWVMKRATLVAIMGLNGSTNYRFLNLQPALSPAGQVLGQGFQLLGKRVVLADDMPAINTNTLSVAYGDFRRGYTIVDRKGVSVRPDPYTAPGFIKYYATARTGGAVTNFEAIKLSKMA